MLRSTCILFACLHLLGILPIQMLGTGRPSNFLCGAEQVPVAPAPRLAAKKVAAIVESSLITGHNQIRQFAFDDDPNTYFESEKSATKADHFTLTLDAPVTVATIRVITGKPNGTEILNSGVLEVSSDGKKFEMMAKFEDGVATGHVKNKSIKMLRIRPTEDLDHPLVLREIVIDSKPAVAVFKYPIEFAVESEAHDMKEWTNRAAQICERHYGMICDELMSPGFKPLTVIHLTLKNDYNGVAAAGGGRITGSVKYFRAHLDDYGAMVHETTHCIQQYRSRGNPGWLVEGIADYIRFFKYEPGKIGRQNAERAKYDGSYRVTAAFLGFVVEKYDPQIVTKLNAIMREGKYKEEVWKELTGKTVEELNQEWRRSLVR
jgi:hypothetical protein